MRQCKDPTRKAAKNLGNVKIEATASDGAENAIDHAVASFLVFWGHRKGGASKEAPLMREYTMLSIGEQLVLETYKGMGSTFKIQC